MTLNCEWRQRICSLQNDALTRSGAVEWRQRNCEWRQINGEQDRTWMMYQFQQHKRCPPPLLLISIHTSLPQCHSISNLWWFSTNGGWTSGRKPELPASPASADEAETQETHFHHHRYGERNSSKEQQTSNRSMNCCIKKKWQVIFSWPQLPSSELNHNYGAPSIECSHSELWPRLGNSIILLNETRALELHLSNETTVLELHLSNGTRILELHLSNGTRVLELHLLNWTSTMKLPLSNERLN